MDVSEIGSMIRQQGEAFSAFQAKHNGRVDALERLVGAIEAKANRPARRGQLALPRIQPDPHQGIRRRAS